MITIGLAPLVLLSAFDLLLLLIAPIALVPLFFFFVASNAAGAAGDFIIASQLMSFSSDNIMEDNNVDLIIYEPKRNKKTA